MAEKDGTSRSQRRTRSQAAPEWASVEELVLVNEIAAVEADCKRELSWFQKWKIIAENCAAQDVSRTLSQFRRKLDSLLDDYGRVAEFASRSKKVSYWSMDAQRRERLGLPGNFDREVFAAVRSLVRARENLPESEPEDDGGAKDDVVELAEELGADDVAIADARIYKYAKGSRKKRQRSSSSHGKCSWKSLSEDNLSETSAETKPSKSFEEEEEIEKSPEPKLEKSPKKSSSEESPTKKPLKEEEPHQGSTENPAEADSVEGDEVAVDFEAKERIIAKILSENAKRINSMAAENMGHDMKDSEDDRTKSLEILSLQANEIISCLGVIVKTLEQLYAQEC